MRNLIDEMARVDIVEDKLVEFFRSNYERDFGEIPTNAKDRREELKLDRVRSAMGSFMRRFDDEREIAGATAWNAFNAYSGLIQHDMKARGKDDADRVERRIASNLYGLNQERTQKAFAEALMIAS